MKVITAPAFYNTGSAYVTRVAQPVSFNDQNITNVGDIALDSISADGTNITISSASGNDVLIGESGNTILSIDGGTDTIGISGNAHARMGLYLSTTLPVGSDTRWGIYSEIHGNSTSTNSGYLAGFAAQPYLDAANTADWDGTVGIRGLSTIPGSAQPSSGTTTITGVAGVYIANPDKGTNVTYTNTYGIYIEDHTRGTNDYGIYVAGADTYALWIDADVSRFDGAISLGTDHGNDGQQLTSGGDDAACDWTAASSLRSHKHIGKEADPNESLQAILSSTPYHFQYKQSMGTGDSTTEYVGVMADDAPWAMHYSGTIVNPVNALGYTVGAIQALHDKIQKLEAQLA
jgi:hypothetical protein